MRLPGSYASTSRFRLNNSTVRKPAAIHITPASIGRQSREADGSHRVRLSGTGRWLLGLGEPPVPPPVFPRTLLVQPNLEILAYRQGLTPAQTMDLTFTFEKDVL